MLERHQLSLTKITGDILICNGSDYLTSSGSNDK